MLPSKTSSSSPHAKGSLPSQHGAVPSGRGPSPLDSDQQAPQPAAGTDWMAERIESTEAAPSEGVPLPRQGNQEGKEQAVESRRGSHR
ncbi:MAG: hypothetical protein V4739_05740 [Pseudomonadota bacterium]